MSDTQDIIRGYRHSNAVLKDQLECIEKELIDIKELLKNTQVLFEKAEQEKLYWKEKFDKKNTYKSWIFNS